MADEQTAPCFAEDVTVKFVGGKVCELLRLHRQTWQRSCAAEEFQTLLKGFFERQPAIFFWSSKKGCLVASNEVLFLRRISQKSQTAVCTW